MLSSTVSIARRFQRATRLDADLGSPQALEGFVCQRSAADGLTAMAQQIARSRQRAFTWTGPYGGGKSSLALAVAGLLGPKGAVRNAAAAALGRRTSEELLEALRPSGQGWLAIPVVGRRSDPVADIGAALEEARRRGTALRGRPRRPVQTGQELIARLAAETTSRPRDGVLLVIDELGKFLEGAAASGGDIGFFQDLAESASRLPGRLVIIGVLHQAFERYATRLGRETADEWAKIQGRFVDIPLIVAVDEVVDLLGRAIICNKKHPATRSAAEAVAASIRSRRPTSPSDLGARLDACWPLHPVTAAVLGPMSRRRFGQNERSIFGFLTSAEPGAFQDFLRNQRTASEEFFGPDRLYDYLRTNLEPAILASNDSHRWAQAADAIERCEARGSALHVGLAKTISVIDLFRNGSGVAADRTTLGACLAGSKDSVASALADLERWSVAVFRKHLGAWSIYAGSDFDIEGAVRSVARARSELDLNRLAKVAMLQPVVAKRHYRETGSLRWFQIDLVTVAGLERPLERAGDAAGSFLLTLPEAGISRAAALERCRAASSRFAEQLVAIGLPRNAHRISELGTELIALDQVRISRPELEGDKVARREISARVGWVSAQLEEEMRAALAKADWFVRGERLSGEGVTTLSRVASDLADRRFCQAPHIRSELVNRQRPSSNTQAAVRDLMHAMIAAPEKEVLGIEGYPAERGLYSTVIASAGLHQSEAGGERYLFRDPPNTKIGRTFRPAWEAAEKLLRSESGPIPLGRLYAVWEAPPFGIRRGVMPILALCFMLARGRDLALYSEKRFQPDIDDYFVDVLLQDENLVALRRIEFGGPQAKVLSATAHALERVTGQSSSSEPLELARSLVRFARDLPSWTRKTMGLSSATGEVRRVLLQADDPHRLFAELAGAFKGSTDISLDIENALRDLGSAYASMLRDLTDKMLRALGHSDSDLEDLRQRARTIVDLTGDLRLDAFATRLTGFSGATDEIEAIASLAINRPPREWNDRDPDQAALAIAEFALQFRRAEALARVKGRPARREAIAVVIGTGEQGSAVVEEFEVDEGDRSKIVELSDALSRVLHDSGAEREVLLAALAQASLGTVKRRVKSLRRAG